MIRDVLIALAGRCEAINAPSSSDIWKLNGDIAKALGLSPDKSYVKSIDDALNLMPEGAWGDLIISQPAERRPFASVPYRTPVEGRINQHNINQSQSYASTMPLALCAASLRARAGDMH